MTFDTVLVLTGKPADTLLQSGATGNWRANESSVRRCQWVVAARNSRAEDADAAEPHGTAFLIGHISGVKPAAEADRLVITFDRYARLDMPNVWPDDHRNPVAYTMLRKLKIDPASLEWRDVSQSEDLGPEGTRGVIKQAKEMIARALAIDVDDVKITIDF